MHGVEALRRDRQVLPVDVGAAPAQEVPRVAEQVRHLRERDAAGLEQLRLARDEALRLEAVLDDPEGDDGAEALASRRLRSKKSPWMMSPLRPEELQVAPRQRRAGRGVVDAGERVAELLGEERQELGAAAADLEHPPARVPRQHLAEELDEAAPVVAVRRGGAPAAVARRSRD